MTAIARRRQYSESEHSKKKLHSYQFQALQFSEDHQHFQAQFKIECQQLSEVYNIAQYYL